MRLDRSGGFDRRELRAIVRIVEERRSELIEAWHDYSKVEMEVPDALSLDVSDDALTVELSDARKISVPLAWFPRLLYGKLAERRNWRLIGSGQGIHWDDLDEDVSVESLLAGRRSGESQSSLKRWLLERQRG